MSRDRRSNRDRRSDDGGGHYVASRRRRAKDDRRKAADREPRLLLRAKVERIVGEILKMADDRILELRSCSVLGFHLRPNGECGRRLSSGCWLKREHTVAPCDMKTYWLVPQPKQQ